jgi:hypothetical protein
MADGSENTEISQGLRRAIENLIDAKLLDALGKPGGLDRLLAHRRTGVASFDIRQAEKRLDEALMALLSEQAGAGDLAHAGAEPAAVPN